MPKLKAVFIALWITNGLFAFVLIQEVIINALPQKCLFPVFVFVIGGIVFTLYKILRGKHA